MFDGCSRPQSDDDGQMWAEMRERDRSEVLRFLSLRLAACALARDRFALALKRAEVVGSLTPSQSGMCLGFLSASSFCWHFLEQT